MNQRNAPYPIAKPRHGVAYRAGRLLIQTITLLIALFVVAVIGVAIVFAIGDLFGGVFDGSIFTNHTIWLIAGCVVVIAATGALSARLRL
jgi:hypothetical protein